MSTDSTQPFEVPIDSESSALTMTEVGTDRQPYGEKKQGEKSSGNGPKLEPQGSELANPGDDQIGEAPSGSRDSRDLSRDTFVSSVYLLVGLTVLQKALGFIRSIVICQNLAPEQLGRWTMTLTTLETFSPLLILSIPACFGRYFEQFESRGQLKGFIRQSLILIATCFFAGLAFLFLFRNPLSYFIYGDANNASMFLAGLVIVIPFGMFGVLASIMTGLRKSQSRTISEFVNGVSFTVLAITLVVSGNANAFSIAFSFAGGYLIASLFLLAKVSRVYRQLRPDERPLEWGGTWARLAPAIFVFWASDFISNLFFSVDRYMIINLSPVDLGKPLEQVGNYEAAHVMPFLMSAFMALVAKVLLPYIAKDWEVGKRELVAHKVNLSVKLGGVVLIAGATLFLWISGFLFDALFQGKYPGGLGVLSLVVFFYVISAMSFLLLNYFWCCERGRFAIAGLVGGLTANVLINIWLIQTQGIRGAAVGTVVAVITQFVFLWSAAVWVGMRFDWRTLLVVLSSVVILISPQAAIMGIAFLGMMTISGLLLTPRERQIIFNRSM